MIAARLHWIAALAILVRLLVPVGFMPQVAHGRVAIVACPGMVAAHGHAHGDAPDHDGFAKPCAFAAVAMAATILAVLLLLAVPFARVVGVAVRATPLPARAPRRWRPPLRAPPAFSSIH